MKRAAKTTRSRKGKKNPLPLPLAALGTASTAAMLPQYARGAQGVYRDVVVKGKRLMGRNPVIELTTQYGRLPISQGHIEFTDHGSIERYERDGCVYRAYTATPVFEDGYRMGAVESWATGRPVSVENPVTPNRIIVTPKISGKDAPSDKWQVGRVGFPVETFKSKRGAMSRANVMQKAGGGEIKVITSFGNLRRNPESTAADLYEEFHGTPSTEVIEVEDEVRMHGHLAGLGALIQIVVNLAVGGTATLDAPNPDGPDAIFVASSEDGKQLYLSGGDQSLDLDALGFQSTIDIDHEGHSYRASQIKDLMVIGKITKLTYRTQKKFDKFEEIDYYHAAGEDTKVRPILLYDTLNSSMAIAGGEYHVHADGVVN